MAKPKTPHPSTGWTSASMADFMYQQMNDIAKAAMSANKDSGPTDDNLKKSVDKEKTKIKEGQKTFLEVFGLKPRVCEEIPVTCYKPEDWHESMRFLIPKRKPEFVWPQDALEDLVVGIELGDNIWVSGPTGSGKSTLLEQFCAATGRPYVRFNGREDTEADAFFGKTGAKDGSTFWTDGDFTAAFRHGALVLIDEATVIPAGIMMGLQWTLEPDGKLLLTDKQGTTDERVVERDPRFRAVYADNTRGLGDITGAHAGTGIVNTAQLDRMGTTIYLDYLEHADELRLLTKRFPKVEISVLSNLVKFAALVRAAYMEGNLSLTMSPRALITIANKVAYHGNLNRALTSSYLHKLEDSSEIDAVKRFFSTVFDKKL